ncbi:hypothetical protein [Cellulomonas flavigena]|uniref:hypothetical protein n=1 Tax=Cellulomonas flavigena TaxID=1711 RepID=UPI000B32DB9C|nr:hypothetical protein [Cellulomonas flavigena]
MDSAVPYSAGTVEFAESFSWDFPVSVSAVLDLQDQCDAPIAALDEAIGDASIARGQVAHQTAALVETVVEHLTNVISASEHALAGFRSVRSALEDYAGALTPVDLEYQAIASEAEAAGLEVAREGTSVTVSHPANVPAGVGVVFAALHARCTRNQRTFSYAEAQFGEDLAQIDPSLWESTITPIFNGFVSKYGFPTGDDAAKRIPDYVDTMRTTAGDVIESAYLKANGATYQPPPGIKDASLWKRVTAPGELKNWKVSTVDAVADGSRTIRAADALRVGGKVAGAGLAVLDGAITAYDTYQSDSYHHPEMGEGEKIARAGVMGVASAGGAYVGATYGAQLGAAIGAVGGPIGILAGGIIGGVLGGLAGSSIGTAIASGFNNTFLS